MDRDIADRVLARIAEGSSLRKASQAEGISHCSVLDWIRADKELANQYARVKEISCQMWADQIIEISDEENYEPVPGPRDEDEAREVRFDATAVVRNRLRVDSRKWLLSKLLPKVYGDKLELGGEVRVPVIWPVNPPAIER
jgi:hypothetical protein